MDTSERITTAVAALIFTHAAALYFRVGDIERDLASQARAALGNRGFDHIQVRAEGRDLTLSGPVPNRQTAATAVALVDRIAGVRIVRDALQPQD